MFRLYNNYVKQQEDIPKGNLSDHAPYMKHLGLLIPNEDELIDIYTSLLGVWNGSNWFIDNIDCLRKCCKSAPIRIPCKPRRGIQIVSPSKDNMKSKTVLLAADYAQIELRLIAHLSGDIALCSVFNQSNHVDIFKQIAMKWKKKSNIDDVTGIERKQIKQLCYAILYGAGITTLAKQLDVSLDEAHLMLDGFLATYPGISVFMKSIVASCRKYQFIETILGRRRFLPNIANANGSNKLKMQAERQAVNSVCQGSAADLIKVFF